MATYEQVKSALAELPHKEMVLATCAIVREQAWHLMKDERSKKAIEAAEGYVNGTVTLEKLKDARIASYAASAADASYAAYASAAYASYASYASYAAYASAAYASPAYASAAAAAAYASKLSELRDRQLEIIAEWKKKAEGKTGKDLTLIERLEKALALAKGNQ